MDQEFKEGKYGPLDFPMSTVTPPETKGVTPPGQKRMSTGAVIAAEKMEEFDDILDFVGASGPYQKWMLYGALVPISYILALLSYSTVFSLFIPDHHCSPETPMEGAALEQWKKQYIPMETTLDGTEKYSSCSMCNSTPSGEANCSETVSCIYGWTFSTEDFDSTIATDNLWVCEKDFYPTNVFTISAIGIFVGNIVFGPLADKYGRKPLLWISLTLYMVFAMVSFFVTHIYIVYLVITFIYSLGFPMIYSIPPLLMAELCNNEYRAWTYTASWIAWVLGMASVPLIAYLSRTWFILSMGLIGPGFLIFVLYPFIPESPRWLVTMGRVGDAAKIMRQISKINGTQSKLTDTELEVILKKITDLEKEKEDKVLGFWTLFSTKRLIMITTLISFTWTASSMIYEQITLNTPYMSGNQFLNFFLLATVELPGSVLGGYMIGTLGRRWTPVFFGFLLAIVCAVAGAVPQDLSIVTVTCILLAKFIVTVTIYVAYVQATELFPTPLRVTGSAVCSTCSALLGLLNPTVVYTAKIYSGAPYLVMALLALVGATLSAFLPETLRQHLPETIEDADDFGRGNKFWSIHPDYDRKRRKSIRKSSLSPQAISPVSTLPRGSDLTATAIA